MFSHICKGDQIGNMFLPLIPGNDIISQKKRIFISTVIVDIVCMILRTGLSLVYFSFQLLMFQNCQCLCR